MRGEDCQGTPAREGVEILERYDANADRLFPFKQIHTYNLGIRELLKRCGLDRMVTILDTHGYNTVQKPLYEVASSHTARQDLRGQSLQAGARPKPYRLHVGACGGQQGVQPLPHDRR